jgi:oligopeptide transport system substrate-binding protein
VITQDNTTSLTKHEILNLAISGEPPTLDPTLSGDSVSSRIAHDLFEGLVSFNQNGDPIAGLAESWDISSDKMTYTFHLRPNLKFSDGSRLTASDVVKSWQRFADPKNAASQNNMVEIIQNGADIVAGKLPVSALGVMAPDDLTVSVKIVHPQASFLSLLASSGFSVVPTQVIAKYKDNWLKPEHIVTSGAYVLKQHILNGYMILEKNPFYYDKDNVKIAKVKYHAISDLNSQYNQYQAGEIDVTDSIPNDRYSEIKAKYPQELYTVEQEGIYFYDFNMMRPEFKNNLKLRQALTMAIDRNVLTQKVLGQGQIPLYSVVSATVESGQYKNIVYPWASWSRDKQITEAKKLYAEAGFNSSHPLSVDISYNTLDSHKKIAITIASMWKNILGVNVVLKNQEWKTFLLSRQKGDYQIARDGWIAGRYITNYTDFMFLCKSPQNNSHYCSLEYDKLIHQADYALDPKIQFDYNQQALKLVMNAYPIIPLYQYTYSRLIKSYVKGYNPQHNHGNDVLTKWMYF